MSTTSTLNPRQHCGSPRLVRRQGTLSTSKPSQNEWRLPALRIEQTPGKVVYCFAVDGRQVHHFASITRIEAAGEGKVAGYQRPEVQRHIAEIRAYIDTDTAMIPNAVVLAFDPKGLRFEGGPDASNGTAIISLGPNGEKTGFIVDGQQRLGAIRESTRAAFPIYATAFITQTIEEQREQFVLVNNTKPLPKGLIYELLPSIDAQIPKALQAKKIPAYLTALLDSHKGSPFRGLIKRPTNPSGIVQDSSIQNMIASSISDGALRQFSSLNGFNVDAGLVLLINYWSLVQKVFPEAWGQNPKASRLMHGTGIAAMGRVMDYIYQKRGSDFFIQGLRFLPIHCAWTNGSWALQGGLIPWNRIQNTTHDKRLLATHLTNIIGNALAD